MSQEEKSFINLAGEFLVAGELNRRRLAASITYGPSKSADIYVFSRTGDKLAKVEVKATEKSQWPVGHRAMSDENEKIGIFWVLVRLPIDANLVPEYHVFTGEEITKLTRHHYKEYMDGYKLKHGHDYDVSKGDVPNLKYTQVSTYRGGWHKIENYLK
jgi:hypothetical protein